MSKPQFPFSAVVGQHNLKLALILASIDTAIGGVLVAGPKGSAKSTLARAINDVVGEQFCELVTLPLNASEEQLVGSLDLDKILGDNTVAFSPGLLAKAHRGVLYIDEVNLLPDHLVDLLLDAAAQGVNYVERDGISHSHPAEFTLIGTMNPDEGEVRAQLADRFGLAVILETAFSAEQRVEVVRRRRAFDNDPIAFCERFASQQHDLRQRISDARSRLSEIHLPEQQELYIAKCCMDSAVDGLRADIVWQRAAIAYAAWENVAEVNQSHCDAVAELVLSHRRSESQSPNKPPPPINNERSTQRDNNSQRAQEKSKQEDLKQQGDFGAMEPQFQLATGEFAVRIGKKQPNSVMLPRGDKKDLASRSQSIDWFKTLTSSRNLRRSRQNLLSALLFKPERKREKQLYLVLLDTSGSLLKGKTLAKAKGLILGIANEVYLVRQQLAILGFSNRKTQWLLPPSRAPKDCRSLLDNIGGGGGTPLNTALAKARQFIENLKLRAPGTRCKTVLITDGRVREFHQQVRWPGALCVVDAEMSAVKLGKSKQLAQSLGGGYIPLGSAQLVI